MQNQKITIKNYNSLPTEARLIREEVFMKEQGFKNEFDEWDEKVCHVVLFINDQPAATGRLLPTKEKTTLAIGRIAVLKKYRKLHLGSQVMLALEEEARKLKATTIELSAQCNAQEFYNKLGYIATGKPYLDEHCEHIMMHKKI